MGVGAFGKVVHRFGGAFAKLLQHEQLSPTQAEVPFGTAGRETERANDAPDGIERRGDGVIGGGSVWQTASRRVVTYITAGRTSAPCNAQGKSMGVP